MSGSAGLEGRSRDRLEDGLAPLDAEGRHDGGGEGALRGRGQGVAHEGGAESSHGEYGVVSGEWRGGWWWRWWWCALQCNAVFTLEAIVGRMRRNLGGRNVGQPRQPRRQAYQF